MDAVMLSIRPAWCELIASGKKTLEIRKTQPKLPTPFKCYIYCTKDGFLGMFSGKPFLEHNKYQCNGKVIGEFICDYIRGEPEVVYESLCDVVLCKESCLSPKEIISYVGNGVIYSWHISALQIYDKPKELSEFYRYCDDKCNCSGCVYHDESFNPYDDGNRCTVNEKKPIMRPFQSWGYVEELQ